jgi:hypothetical protein
MLTACALAALLFAQQYSPPEGPDGLVYNKDWPTRRLATQRQGKWDAWRMHARPGNGGQTVALAPAEAAQVEAVLKAIAQTVESGPYAQAQRGWYASRSVAWIRTRFPTARFPLAKLPVESYYSLYPFHLMDKLVTQNGVQQWVPDWSHETTSISFTVNGVIPGPSGGAIFTEDQPGDSVRWYAGAAPDGVFHGMPVFGGVAVIARQDRPLFREVPLKRALDKFLPLYREDVKAAGDRLRGYQQQLAEAESEAFARREMEEFEQEYGSWKSTRPRDYEFRRKTRLESIERTRQEARQQANPKDGDPEGQWYWEPKRALEAAERLAQSATPDQAACFEPAGSNTALYKARGHIRPAGAGPHCKSLMEPNPDYYDTALPRTATQLITIGNLSRCIDVRTGALAPGNYPPGIPHGCNVHIALWAEMDWKKLAALLAP